MEKMKVYDLGQGHLLTLVSLWSIHTISPQSDPPGEIMSFGVSPVIYSDSKIFFSETAWPIKVKFYLEHPWEWGTNVWLQNPGHMTKMATTSIYGKNHSKIFS